MLTYASVLFDSRVQRFTLALADAGHDILLLSPDKPDWRHDHVAQVSVPAFGETRKDLYRNLVMMAPASLVPNIAHFLHRRHPSHRASVQALTQFMPDAIHANDWATLPAAAEAAQTTGASIVYDTHEMATQEHEDRQWWRLFAAPHIKAVEGRLIGKAKHVITVSDGIAYALTDLYGSGLPDITVVRNLPEQTSCTTKQRDGTERKLVYAGLIRPERHIDVMIEAVARLDKRHSLTIIGFGPETYIAGMKELGARLGVADRVIWRDAVAPNKLVGTLAGHDIGLFLSAGKTVQQRNALPNKIFEYTCARLAVIASGSVDVADLLAHERHGVALAANTAETLADTLKTIADRDLLVMQQNAAEAAERLNWSNERDKLLQVYTSTLAQGDHGQLDFSRSPIKK